jgi:hypothetical protein
MENMRRGDGRKGQSHNNTADRRDQLPMGFEGMNYEQKRKPYGESSSEKKRTANYSDNNSGKRQDDL